VNRIFVHQGVQRMRCGRARPGIIALADVARRPMSRLVSSDLGFAIAPRLNAAGRMDDMSTGIQCLLSDNMNDARHLANDLDQLNRDRKSVEQGMQQEAMRAVEQLHLDNTVAGIEQLPWGLCVFDENWHQGVVGLLASRLKERYHRPVIAFAPAGATDRSPLPDDTIKGSARSIEGLHIRDALDAVATQHPAMIEKFGGHAMAAGLSLSRQHLPAFMQAFDQHVRTLLDEKQLQAVLETDGELSAGDFLVSTATLLRNSEPWGQHFPAPLFEGHFQVLYKRPVGEQHLRLVLQPVLPVGPTLVVAHGQAQDLPLQQIDAIVFFIDNSLKEQITAGDQLHVVYQLDVNEYQGEENLQLIIEYLEKIS
jgi:single-stranded-DNA-specific exonuclease